MLRIPPLLPTEDAHGFASPIEGPYLSGTQGKEMKAFEAYRMTADSSGAMETAASVFHRKGYPLGIPLMRDVPTPPDSPILTFHDQLLSSDSPAKETSFVVPETPLKVVHELSL
jgi:hypothetical protein